MLNGKGWSDSEIGPVVICSFGLEMKPVFFVLFAGIGHDARVLPLEIALGLPRASEKDRIIKRHAVMDRVGAGLLERFSQPQFVAVLVALGIQPGSVIDADGINDELGAFPMSD